MRQRTFAQGTLTQPSGKRYGELASLMIIATSSDDLLSRLRAGEAASAALLHATKLGMASCPLSQPLEIADTRRVVQDDVLAGRSPVLHGDCGGIEILPDHVGVGLGYAQPSVAHVDHGCYLEGVTLGAAAHNLRL